MTNINPAGWRNIFWIQAALHGTTSLGILAFYWPKKRSDYPKMSFKEWSWACDPIGSVLFIASATLMLLALNWAGGAYKWSDPHVCANLVVGIVLLLAFCLYGEHLRVLSELLNAVLIKRQNGKAEPMASLHMSSSATAPTFGLQPLHSPLKGKFNIFT